MLWTSRCLFSNRALGTDGSVETYYCMIDLWTMQRIMVGGRRGLRCDGAHGICDNPCAELHKNGLHGGCGQRDGCGVISERCFPCTLR
eukprot:NODE_1078_length_1014_cov_131.010363_g894_i0.p4 GENE.NODE_1078_length_1014_cov_131.010363_g894_i0~~NODE_1078_length_1014_cov_131.010363_g894_i0.p4  ORF type:complete len:88 (-),score=10.63 NODE_1078_length_1014_cov_131.010363_g894_i0:5-268(-)